MFKFYDRKNPKIGYALAELYQPIFNHHEFDSLAKRSCYDRLETVQKVSQELEQFLKKPLRVLDLGCAQGFFSFNLAVKNYTVTAVDSDEINIKFCIQMKMGLLKINSKI